MDPKQLALQFFDKLILAAFGAWLVLSGVGMASDPPGLDKKEGIDKDLATISEHMKGSTVPATADAGWKTALEQQLKPDTVRTPPPAPPFTMERRPYFLYQVHIDQPTYSCKHDAPTDLTTDASQRGQVVLRWKPSMSNEYV